MESDVKTIFDLGKPQDGILKGEIGKTDYADNPA
jgi:hypothetical protein